MRSKLHLHFRKYYREYGLIQPGERLLLAVSGGVDSVVLLHLLLRWRQQDQLHLEIVHLNHQLRGTEADMDAAFVQRLAEENGLPCHMLIADVAQYARDHRFSLEEAGRNLRKMMFEELCQQLGLNKIVTAHHGDDQAETVLMRLLKGAGLEGLAGIRRRNGCWIRPLLFATREEIEEYAVQNQLKYRTDSSNTSDRFFRNRLRNELLPFLEQEYSPALKSKLQNLADIFSDFQDFAARTYQECLQNQRIQLFENKNRLEIPSFNLYFTGLKYYLVKRIVARLTGDENYAGFNKFRRFLLWVEKGQTGSVYCWDKRVEVWHLGNWVEFRQREDSVPQQFRVEPVRWYHLPGTGIQIILEPVARNDVKFHNRRDEEYICGDRLEFPLTCRLWQHGDRIKPLGLRSRKKVSDYLTDKKIAGPERRNQWVLLNNEDILAVIGVGMAEDFKVTEDCKLVYRLTIKKGNSCRNKNPLR